MKHVHTYPHVGHTQRHTHGRHSYTHRLTANTSTEMVENERERERERGRERDRDRDRQRQRERQRQRQTERERERETLHRFSHCGQLFSTTGKFCITHV